MASRISYADLADATGIAPDLLEAEATALQRASSLLPPAEKDAAPESARRFEPEARAA
jgi:hypothetical protein